MAFVLALDLGAQSMMTLTQLSEALANVPDDVLFARLRAAGFHVGEPQPKGLDQDHMATQRDHEDWWRKE